MKKAAISVYALLSRLAFLGVVMYALGFITNFLVPKSIDRGNLFAGLPAWAALPLDAGLLLLFVLGITRLERSRTQATAAGRSSAILASGLALALLMAAWQPIPKLLWSADAAFGRTLYLEIYWAVLAALVLSVFLAQQAGLFRQRWIGRERPEQLSRRSSPGDPISVRLAPIAAVLVLWITPEMSVGHLLIAAGMNVYLVIHLYLEQRDLAQSRNEAYAANLIRRRVTPG